MHTTPRRSARPARRRSASSLRHGGTGLTCNPFATGTAYNCSPTGGGPACGSSIPFDLSSFNGLGYTYLAAESLPRRVSHDARLDRNDPRALLHGLLEQLRHRGIVVVVERVAQRLRYRSALPGRRDVRSSTPTAAGGSDPNGWLCITGHGPAVKPTNTTFNDQHVTFHDQQPGESVYSRPIT